MVWVGITCCVVALALNLFPAAAEGLGVDLGGARPIFAFGVFLIFASVIGKPPNRAGQTGPAGHLERHGE